MRPTRRIALISTILAIIAVAMLLLLIRDRWEEEKGRVASLRQENSIIKTRVAMKWIFAGTMSPYFAAQRNGVFRDHGLDVTLLPGGPTTPSVQQVLLNKADFGITGAHELAMARSEDQPLVSVAVIFKTSPVCLASLKESKIAEPADLVGKTVEMTAGDNAEFEYLAMLKKAGIAPERIKREKFIFQYTRLVSGQTDAAVVYANDQAITLAKENKEISLLCPSQFGVTPYADVLFTTEDMMAKNPDLVRRVVIGFLEAWEWAIRNSERTVDYFLEAPEIKTLNLNKADQTAILAKSIEFVRGTTSSVDRGSHLEKIGWQEGDRWQETVDLIRDYAAVDKVPSAGHCFTNRWVKLHELMAKSNNSNGKGDSGRQDG
ncbi:MAG TPA: ABC transporter substrate-binding protein [Thermoanaerobaculia bacterium]